MIKAVLKRNNILLSEFADSLNISRPTLDTYIRNYDSGVRLSNNLFQKIFKVEPKKNFITEVENCLADFENSLDSLSGSNVKKIAEKYNINTDLDFIDERINAKVANIVKTCFIVVIKFKRISTNIRNKTSIFAFIGAIRRKKQVKRRFACFNLKNSSIMIIFPTSCAGKRQPQSTPRFWQPTEVCLPDMLHQTS